ncbi:hypothetical protein [Chitinophaga sp. Cy-1792]|uniref:hypothetical protein n=1 Tax=Chitinophaga sp. Cy-1792 TaxID=2608339 RepID=UPI00141F9B7E|nr:hypothetical protein [Chitinophaga sp. Cy-1792]NIG53069.1 hypothetical protein [Chitinophaga sp. Cy-1792]
MEQNEQVLDVVERFVENLIKIDADMVSEMTIGLTVDTALLPLKGHIKTMMIDGNRKKINTMEMEHPMRYAVICYEK